MTTFEHHLRDRLTQIADGLIPATDEMPAPSAVDVGGRQLDVVLAARPDLADDLRRALETTGGDPFAHLELLATDDLRAHDALVTAVIAGYYLHRAVQRRLGYPGQIGEEVRVDTYPEYVHEGQLERVLERGPIYRPTPSR
ncbi:MAG: hypothetical protein QOE98_935 [Gaiellaceae bacterium]|nr:hypothetical protein [Gaiellaceae bacterium]